MFQATVVVKGSDTTSFGPGSTGGTNGNVTKPANLQQGDTIFCCTSTASGTAPTAPTGGGTWVHQTSLDNSALFLFNCYTLSLDPVNFAAIASVTQWNVATGGSSGQLDSIMLPISGLNLITPVNAFGAWCTYVSAGTLAVTGAAATVANTRRLMISYAADGAGGTKTVTPPTGYTNETGTVSTSNAAAYFFNNISSQTVAAVGTTSTDTITWTGGGPNNGGRAIQIVLQPAMIPSQINNYTRPAVQQAANW